MLPVKNKPAVVTVLACAAVAAALTATGGPAGRASGIAEASAGPSGRVALRAWTQREDPADRGSSLGWQRGGFQGSAVTVPDVVRPQDFTGRAGVANYDGSVVWYRTTFRAAHSGTYALSFQSANFLAEVWVDGRLLGAHRGSYLPFEMRDDVAAGTHTVVVRVDWRNPSQQAREGFHRTWFNWGGIDGAVEVRPIGESELYEPTLRTRLSAGRAIVTVRIEVRNDGPARTITPAGALERGSTAIALSFAPLTLAEGQAGRTSATATVAAPALWSPSAPSLYSLAVAVGQESSYTARVGLRQLSWSRGRVFLNGSPLLLHGATVQQDAPGVGDALSTADDDRIVAHLKMIGANAVRSQHPLDAALLERLDAAGVLVWQGIGPVEGAGNWYSDTPRLLAAAERQAREAVAAEEVHPSIVAWNLVDEVAGNGRDADEAAYVNAMADWIHEHDPAAMVAVDVWGDHPPRTAGGLYTHVDAVAETDYSGWYDYPSASPAEQTARMRERLAAMARTFPRKVLVISEFGAESNALNGAGAPGSYAYQSRLLAAHVRVYAADARLGGMFVYLLADYPLTPTFDGGAIHGVLPRLRLIEGLNQKGLFTRAGRPKPAVAVIARLFGQLPPG